jgi:hypothetical protein
MKEFESMEEMKEHIKKTVTLRENRRIFFDYITQAHELGETKGYDEGDIDGYKDCLQENKFREVDDYRLEEEFDRGYESGAGD